MKRCTVCGSRLSEYLLSEQFSSAYAGTLGNWCEENHLKLTGHVMQEESLEGQTRCVGEAMRTYPYFQLPGIDILADRYEYTTAKQAQSVSSRQSQESLVRTDSERKSKSIWLNRRVSVSVWNCRSRSARPAAV